MGPCWDWRVFLQVWWCQIRRLFDACNAKSPEGHCPMQFSHKQVNFHALYHSPFNYSIFSVLTACRRASGFGEMTVRWVKGLGYWKLGCHVRAVVGIAWALVWPSYCVHLPHERTSCHVLLINWGATFTSLCNFIFTWILMFRGVLAGIKCPPSWACMDLLHKLFPRGLGATVFGYGANQIPVHLNSGISHLTCQPNFRLHTSNSDVHSRLSPSPQEKTKPRAEWRDVSSPMGAV